MMCFYLCLLAFLLATYWCVLSRVKRQSRGLTPLLGWLMGLGFFLIAPLVILTLHGGYEMPPSDGITESWTKINLANPIFFRPYIVIWLSLMLTCVSVLLTSGAAIAGDARELAISCRRLERVILIAMALSLVDWAVLVWLVGGVAEFMVSHWYLRSQVLSERFGGGYTLYTRISLANQLLFTGAAALHTGLALRDRNPRWGFSALIFLFLIMEMIMSGNRIFIAFYLLAFVASCWLHGRRTLIAILMVASPVLILLFSAWGAVRHDLSKIPDILAGGIVESDMSGEMLSNAMHVTEGGAVLLLMHIVNDFGDKFDYLYGSTYGRVFTFWLPRSVYPGRPLDFTSQAATFYLPGETTSLCSTALGEACANFGLAGIVALPLCTLGVVFYTKYLARGPGGHPLLSAVSFVVLIWLARCTFAENVINLMEVALLIWALKLEKGLCASKATVPANSEAPAERLFPSSCFGSYEPLG